MRTVVVMELWGGFACVPAMLAGVIVGVAIKTPQYTQQRKIWGHISLDTVLALALMVCGIAALAILLTSFNTYQIK